MKLRVCDFCYLEGKSTPTKHYYRYRGVGGTISLDTCEDHREKAKALRFDGAVKVVMDVDKKARQ